MSLNFGLGRRGIDAFVGGQAALAGQQPAVITFAMMVMKMTTENRPNADACNDASEDAAHVVWPQLQHSPAYL